MEYLRQLVLDSPNAVSARNRAREYLQAQLLASLQRAGAMNPLAFHGGTALRFLFALPRHSEDLDFALERSGFAFDLRATLVRAERDLVHQGYRVEVKLSLARAVKSAWVRFPGLPFVLGFSPHQNQVLAVRIEVDTRPPAGAILETTVVRRHVTLQLQHHDRSSLLAGKLHAILERPYTKGRDLYDLLWYLSDPGWPEPNLVLLNNALRQTGNDVEPLTQITWRKAVRTRLEALDWKRVVSDVRPFLEAPGELDLLSRENLVRLL
jgi:hypothetical protein